MINDKCLLQLGENNTSSESYQEERKDNLISNKEDNFHNGILQPDNEISIAEPSYDTSQLDGTDETITIKAVHTNIACPENVPTNVNDTGKNSHNTLTLRNVGIRLFNQQSTENQTQSIRLKEDSTRKINFYSIDMISASKNNEESLIKSKLEKDLEATQKADDHSCSSAIWF